MIRFRPKALLHTTLLASLLILGGAPAHRAYGEDSLEDKLARTREIVAGSEGARNSKTPGQSTVPAFEPSDEEGIAQASVRMFKGLGIVVALLLIASWAYRRFYLKESPASARNMKVLERVPVSPKTSLVLAEIHGRKVLVALGSEYCSVLPWDSSPKKQSFDISLEKAYETDF